MENPLEKFKKLHKFYFGSLYLTKDLAEYIGVNARTIQRWMRGQNTPPKDKLKKIETYLKNKTKENLPSAEI